MLGAAAALLAVSLPACSTYCAPFGQNPGFTRAPTVEQVTLTSVRVSWAGTVTRIECADQFIVKSWNRRNPNDYMMSDLLPLDQFSYIVTDLVPNQDYVFQAVAREDKGILGKDWNKSPQADFKTQSANPTVKPRDSLVRAAVRGPVNSDKETQNSKALFTVGAMVVGGLLGSLVLVGMLWNLVKKGRNKSADSDSDHSDSDTDSMDLDLENTDLESRVGSMRAPSRAGSRVSTIRSSTIRSSARSRLRSPRRFSLTLSEPSEDGEEELQRPVQYIRQYIPQGKLQREERDNLKARYSLDSTPPPLISSPPPSSPQPPTAEGPKLAATAATATATAAMLRLIEQD